MGNKITIFLVFIIVFISSCSSKEDKGSDRVYVDTVTIDYAKNEKCIHIIRDFYLGEYGADGWLGRVKYGYYLTVPLGRLRNVVRPDINGTDVSRSCVFGYVTFNEVTHEIFIKCREIDFSNGFVFDSAHGGDARSVEVTGDHDISINGVIHTDNLDAFK